MNDKRLRQVIVITVIFIFNVGSLAEPDTVNPSPGRTRTKRIVRQNVDKQIGGMYFYVEDPSERIDYAG